MLEFIKHAFGLCGEPHLNAITILISTPILGYVIYHLKKFIV